ncbi:MAG TPA: SAM-dependent chlorinase/fluorinase [Candidatus Binatia bacterium]
MAERTIVTLTTDFGYRDSFVGAMKGVLLGLNPDLCLVDITHGIPPQDVMAGALAIKAAVPFFPAGTIHVGVVDPGVGSARRPVLIEAGEYYFVGPDNGLFSLALQEKEPQRIIELTNDSYHLKPTSPTFHGRDIFAPVAARLSLGISAQKLGAATDQFTRLPWPEVSQKQRTLHGEVIYVDDFGNLITNIREEHLRPFSNPALSISIGRRKIRGVSASYAAVAEGEFVALLNSWRCLEIAVRNGSAELRGKISVGARVSITLPKNG